MTIDVVDIDPEVIRVAKTFFGFREDVAMHAHADDGRRYIENCEDPYQLIFLDAFGSDKTPDHLTTREFLQAVRRAVRPEGVVVANVWSRASNRLYDSMVRTYQDVFDELYILDVQSAGNKMFFALPRKRGLTRDFWARQARAISTEKQFRFDMGGVVTYGYRGLEPLESRGRILMDKSDAWRSAAPQSP
jgi:spermidine synthase